MEARNRLFRALKPPCVHLNDTVLKFRSGRATATDLTASLDQLLAALRDITRASPSIDDKLADYVFFPLSSVLRERQTVTVRALELALQCLKLLLQSGWKEFANPDLGVQLLILLTYLAANGSDANQKLSTSDDLQVAAYECTTALYSSLSRSQGSRNALLQTQNIPALGHSVTVMLDGVKDGPSRNVQLSALHSLRSFLDGFVDREMLSSFFPGIVSNLSQVLTPSTKMRRNFRVLEQALIALFKIIQVLLSDSLWNIDPLISSAGVASSTSIYGKDVSWLKATASQVKLALSNVLKLRYHDRKEVRDALSKLCWVVLDDCEHSLSESTVMVLETVVALTQSNGPQSRNDSLVNLLAGNSRMAELLRGNLYDWLVSLPRIMLSNDISAKARSTTHIATSYALLVNLDVDMSMINSAMLSTMSDSVTNTIRKPTVARIGAGNVVLGEESTGVVAVVSDTNVDNFSPVLTSKNQELENIAMLQTLVRKFATSSSSLAIARDALEVAQTTHNDDRLVNLWLSLSLLKERASLTQAFDFDKYVDIDSSDTDTEADLCEDLYTFALSVLIEGSDNAGQDWRQQGLALEILAFQASRLKEGFRVELVDALYPAVHLMASQVQPLRVHAMTCLNLLATACGYENAQDLLISNVDYLVNAIGVKLNTFDLSPEAPQVLLMMLKLCDSKLLLYLDDVVDGIFEALDCFHGYPSLVEMLFSVLRGMVEVGSNAAQFTITMGDKPSHKKSAIVPPSMQQVSRELERDRAKFHKRKDTEPVTELQAGEQADDPGHGRADDITIPAVQPSTDPHGDDIKPQAEDLKPLSKIYVLLQRITSLTQHHLPSSSPAVRISLLSLLTTALPYLSHHDDTFLPLVHTLWPVLVPRLQDKEAYVVAGVLEVMGVICEGAGDFVSSRIEGLWPSIEKIFNDLQTVLQPQFETGKKRLNNARLSAPIRDLEAFGGNDIQPALEPSSRLQSSHPSVSNELILNPFGDRQTMVPARERYSKNISPGTPSYIPSTTLTIRAALTSFLVQLINHVRITHSMFTQISSEMLYDALVYERRADVREALEGRNPDAVWLLMERAKWTGANQEGVEWWKGKMPADIGFLHFVEVAAQ